MNHDKLLLVVPAGALLLWSSLFYLCVYSCMCVSFHSNCLLLLTEGQLSFSQCCSYWKEIICIAHCGQNTKVRILTLTLKP